MKTRAQHFYIPIQHCCFYEFPLNKNTFFFIFHMWILQNSMYPGQLASKIKLHTHSTFGQFIQDGSRSREL